VKFVIDEAVAVGGKIRGLARHCDRDWRRQPLWVAAAGAHQSRRTNSLGERVGNTPMELPGQSSTDGLIDRTSRFSKSIAKRRPRPPHCYSPNYSVIGRCISHRHRSARRRDCQSFPKGNIELANIVYSGGHPISSAPSNRN
jgi:hypothetical protein